MNSDTLSSFSEIRSLTRSNSKCVIMFGIEDSFPCAVVESVLEGIRRRYPSVAFGFVNDIALAEGFQISRFPSVLFFDNDTHVGSLIGRKFICDIDNIIDLWLHED